MDFSFTSAPIVSLTDATKLELWAYLRNANRELTRITSEGETATSRNWHAFKGAVLAEIAHRNATEDRYDAVSYESEIVHLPHGDQFLLPGLAPVEAPALQLSLF